MKLFYGPGGAIVCDEPILDITQELSDGNARFYGGRFMIGETCNREFARWIAKQFNAELSETPLIESESQHGD